MFTTQHYNALAKEIREVMPHPRSNMDREQRLIEASILITLVCNLAKRFKKDNPLFDPIKWLDACSPDLDLMPLSELWVEDESQDS